jgi:14-3-3 protein epsilon
MSRDNLIYQAQLAEQTERFEDMLEFMKSVVKLGGDLNEEERNLLSVAYKNSVGSRRSAWRALSSIEERAGDSDKTKLITDYKAKVEKELDKFCYDILKLIDENLVPQAETTECKVFFLKMKGDYFRYIGEYTKGDKMKEISESALAAYNEATEQANKDLKTTNPIRLGLALNFSVFYYEIMNEPSKACEMAKQAFDDAIANIEDLPEDQYKDSTTIMQLIRDNLTLWTSELAEDEDDEGAE